MKISYHESDDILHIEMLTGAINRDVSLNWNVNVGYTNDDGVGDISILDAQRANLSPSVLNGGMDELLEIRAA